jgi:uncharacterized membrane protein YeaQ/YmgE (transglycosylase-associated protein family)
VLGADREVWSGLQSAHLLDYADFCSAALGTALSIREDIVVGIDGIIIMLVVGAIAGWLAGNIVRGFGFGLIWNIIIGIIGAFIGVWLLTRLGFVPFSGFVGSIVNAVIGAVALLVIVGFIRR